MRHQSSFLARLALIALAAWSTAASAGVVNVSVDAASPWIGFMNVYDLPPSPGTDRGAYQFGVYFGSDIAALPGSVSGRVATMAPNDTFAPDPRDVDNPAWSYWWASDGAGGVTPNKVLETNLYVDSGVSGVPLGGETVRFTGITSASSLAAPYAAYAFIREFAPDYSFMVNEVLVLLEDGEEFGLEAVTSLGNAVQYGFALVGQNADPRTVRGLGSITISAVPEPSTVALVLLGAIAAASRSRRRT